MKQVSDATPAPRLLRHFLPAGDTVLGIVRHGPASVAGELEEKPLMAQMLEELLPPIIAFRRQRRRLAGVSALDQQRLLAPLGAVAGCPIDVAQLEAEIANVARMRQEIMDFVPARYRHQVSGDGRSHLDDALGHLLMACFPQTEFRVGPGEIPFDINTDMRLDSIRSYEAISTLIIAAWLLGRRPMLDQRMLSIDSMTAYLETKVFKTPKDVNSKWIQGDRRVTELSARFDPDAGFAFRSVVECASQEDEIDFVSRSSMPRYILSDDGSRYIQILVWSRRKRVDLLKHLWFRDLNDMVGFRFVFRSKEDFDACQKRLHEMILRFGKANIVNGQRVGESENKFSRQHPGILWQGSVTLEENLAEFQMLTFEAWWLWCMSFQSGSHVAYKWRQWMLPGKHYFGGVQSQVPPAFELLAPPSLYLGWNTWSFKLQALERVLLMHGASEYRKQHMRHVGQAVEQIYQYLWYRPEEGDIPDRIFGKPKGVRRR